MIEQSLTYAGVGAAALGATAWLIWSLIKQAVKRGNAEGSIDDRVTLLLTSIETAYQKQADSSNASNQRMVDMQTTTIEALRLRLEHVQDKLGEAYNRIADMQAQHHKIVTDTVNEVRLDNAASNKRLHERMDKTEEAHKACEARLVSQSSEIAMLQRYLQAPPAGMTMALAAGSSVQVGPTPAAVPA